MEDMNQRTALGISLVAFAALMIAVCLIYELVTPDVALGSLWFSYLVGVVLCGIGFLMTYARPKAGSRHPDVGLSVIREEGIAPDMDKDIRDFLVACFPADREYYQRQSWWHCLPVYRVLGRDANGSIVAHVAIVERTVSVGDSTQQTQGGPAGGGSTIRVAGVQSFCVSLDHRGTGLSDRLMSAAMNEASRRGFDAGLLFCTEKVERVYQRMGWRKLNADVYMYEQDRGKVPIPAKNITMWYPLAKSQFPSGDIDLCGIDW